jgi:hypothetical protein
MDLFENLFYDYNKWILNQTKHLTNQWYGYSKEYKRANWRFLRVFHILILLIIPLMAYGVLAVQIYTERLDFASKCSK